MSMSLLSVEGLDRHMTQSGSIPSLLSLSPFPSPDVAVEVECRQSSLPLKTPGSTKDQEDTDMSLDPDLQAPWPWDEDCRQNRKRAGIEIGTNSVISPPSTKKKKETPPSAPVSDVTGVPLQLKHTSPKFPRQFRPQRQYIPQPQPWFFFNVPPPIWSPREEHPTYTNSGFLYQQPPLPPLVLPPSSVSHPLQYPPCGPFTLPVMGSPNLLQFPQNSATFHPTPGNSGFVCQQPPPGLELSPQLQFPLPFIGSQPPPPQSFETFNPPPSEFHKFIVFGLEQTCAKTFMNEAGISAHFSMFGYVEQVMIRGPLAFVSMSQREAAERIVTTLYHTLHNGLMVECRQIFVSMEEFMQTLILLESKTNPNFWTGGSIPSLTDLFKSPWYTHLLCTAAANAYFAQVGPVNDINSDTQFSWTSDPDGTPAPPTNRVAEQLFNILRKYWDDYQAAVEGCAHYANQHSQTTP